MNIMNLLKVNYKHTEKVFKKYMKAWLNKKGH